MDKNSKKSFYEHWYERGLADVPFQFSFDPSILKAQDNVKEFKKSKELIVECNLDLENKIIMESSEKPLYPKLPNIKSILKPENMKSGNSNDNSNFDSFNFNSNSSTNNTNTNTNINTVNNENRIKDIERAIKNIDSQRKLDNQTGIFMKKTVNSVGNSAFPRGNGGNDGNSNSSKSSITKPFGNNSIASAEKCNLYLLNETEEKKIAYCSLWDATRSLAPDDMDVLRAFFQFDGNVEKAFLFLKSFLALRELGFSEEKITAALLMNDNNQDRALDYLMSQL